MISGLQEVFTEGFEPDSNSIASVTIERRGHPRANTLIVLVDPIEGKYPDRYRITHVMTRTPEQAPSVPSCWYDATWVNADKNLFMKFLRATGLTPRSVLVHSLIQVAGWHLAGNQVVEAITTLKGLGYHYAGSATVSNYEFLINGVSIKSTPESKRSRRR